MIGSSGTLVDKKGGYIIPNITRTATTKTYEMTLPYGAAVVAQNIIFETVPNATISEGGFVCDKQEYTEVKFTVPTNTAVSVFNNKSILYADNELVQIKGYFAGTPVSFYHGCAVVYNNEIHILGSLASKLAHYKWSKLRWEKVSDLPFSFAGGSAVVYNNEIHILGGSEQSTYHYKWDGSSWSSVSTIPYKFYHGSAVVYNNEIHIFGGYETKTNHYKWNGVSWSSVSTIPYNFYHGSAVVYNGEIHLLGGIESKTNHYKYNGQWVTLSAIHEFSEGEAVIYNNEIHMLGGNASTVNRSQHYKWSPENGLVSVSTLPVTFYSGSAVTYDDMIHILGSNSNVAAHYNYTKTNGWRSQFFTTNYQLFKNMKINGEMVTATGKVIYNNLPVFISY